MAPQRPRIDRPETSDDWARIMTWATGWEPFAGTTIGQAIDELRALLESTRPWPGFSEQRPLAVRIGVAIDGLPEWVRLASLCRALAGDPELPALVQRLGQRTWANYEGAVVELEFGARLRKAGVDVRLLSQKSLAANVGPADISARLTDREVLVECTALNPTEVEDRAAEVTTRISRIVLPDWGRPVGVRFEPNANPFDACERFSAIEQAVQAVSRDGGSVDVAGLCGVTLLTTDRGPSWVLPLNGFAFEVDELQHARRALRSKGQKAFESKPAVVVIRLHRLALGAELEAASVEFADEVAADLPGYPGISAVLAYEEWRGSKPPHLDISTARYRIFAGHDEDGSTRLAILIANTGATLPLHEDEARRLVGPQMLW